MLPAGLYRPSLALLTDLYQLTMAQGWWRCGMHRRLAVFHLFFRKHPFGGGFAVAAGLEPALDYLAHYRFDADDLAWLAGVADPQGGRLFDPAFLAELGEARFDCDVDAMPEGTIAFAHEPLLRVTGPLWMAALVETPLLNIVNFQTLIATKAARVALAARGEPVLEFGLRRAQGIDGALSASRAAWLGGCAATSNVLAGRLFGIPVRGTHAHSWVMSFDDEVEAFRAYARAMPGNCVFLVDTYDTLQGVRHAIEVGRELRAVGRRLAGVRLDSGDLAWLSTQARVLLDEAGFDDAAIVASNDLDERVIADLKNQGAAIALWGVGTQLVTGGDQAALGGVYKLAAIQGDDGGWQVKVKLSEQAIKTSNPGILQVTRFCDGSGPAADVIWDELHGLGDPVTMIDPLDPTRRKTLRGRGEDLITRAMRGGRIVVGGGLAEARVRAAEGLAAFHAGIKRQLNPHRYPVGLEGGLFDRKQAMVIAARAGARGA